MQEVFVTGFHFQRMPDGVAEIQDAAQIALAFVGGDHVGLHAHRLGNQPLQRRRVLLQNALVVLLDEVKNVGAANDAALQRLVHSGAKLAVGQRAQRGGIDEHCARLMKRAQQVLAFAQVHAGLAADGGIHLRQQRGRHLHHVDAAHVDRSYESGDVAHHATAQGKDGRFAVHTLGYQLRRQVAGGGERLVALAVGHGDERVRQFGFRERLLHRRAEQPGHSRRGDDDVAGALRHPFAQQRPQPAEQAGLDHHGIWMCWNFDFDYGHVPMITSGPGLGALGIGL